MEYLEKIDIKITEIETNTQTQDQGNKSRYKFLSFILGYNLKHQAIKCSINQYWKIIYAFFLIIGERQDSDTSVESYLIGLRREGEQNYIQRLCSYYKKLFY